jgi:circadian clock protein KaiC
MSTAAVPVPKLPTGIRGFDHIARGGLPAGRSTLLAGTAGSGKTVFAAEFLARGALDFAESGVFVTFDERPEEIRANVASLGIDVAGLEATGRWAFVDGSADLGTDEVVGAYDLEALIARIAHAVDAVGASRIVLDSIAAVSPRFSNPVGARTELARVVRSLRELGLTAVLTAERTSSLAVVAQQGVEEFVTDNVVILRHVGEGERRRRTVEIVKFRGAAHRTGEFTFAIVPGEGISVIPLALISMRQRASAERVGVGSAELDTLLGGGVYRDSVTFVSGPTGIGKTLVATTFAAASAAAGERCLLVSFEESADQIHRNATSWGCDLSALEGAGLLRLVCEYPEVASLEDHFVSLRQHIEAFEPRRLVVDNLSGLERIGTVRGMLDFMVGFTSHLRAARITSLFTSSSRGLLGGDTLTEAHASTLTDAIVLLRYLELEGVVRRALCVLKVRGSAHDHRVHEFTIDDHGLHVGLPFADHTGILTGPAMRLGATREPAAPEPAG